MTAKFEQSQSKAQAFEERLRRYTEKEAAQNKTFDKLLERVEANLAAANARAAQAEQRAAGLEAALDQERSKVAQLEMIEVAPGEFPNWQEARRCIMTQRLMLAQARQRTKEAKEIFKTITEGSAKNLIALAKYVKDFNQLSLMLSSYDKILEEDDGSSALLD